MTLSEHIALGKQHIFDTVVQHAHTQAKRSMAGGDLCLYRAGEGLKCFIGALIDDSEYTPKMEQKHIYALLEFMNISVENRMDDFLYDIQGIHDGYPPVEWSLRFYLFARNENLNTDLLKTLYPF